MRFAPHIRRSSSIWAEWQASPVADVDLPSRLREGLGVGRNDAMAHPAATSEQARKSRCPCRRREGECRSFSRRHPGLDRTWPFTTSGIMSPGESRGPRGAALWRLGARFRKRTLACSTGTIADWTLNPLCPSRQGARVRPGCSKERGSIRCGESRSQSNCPVWTGELLKCHPHAVTESIITLITCQ